MVLVGPEQAANVGFIARTMACYGLSDLRIVGSPGIAADGAARKTGKAVPGLLDAVRYFPSLASALADCGAVFGFTRRSRDPSQRLEDVDTAAHAWRGAGETLPSALVFGRESQGLFREETLLMTRLVRIPIPSETLSLNVSHALAIVLHVFAGTAKASTGTATGMAGATPVDTAQGTGRAPEAGLPSGAGDLGHPSRGKNAAAMEALLSALEASGYFREGKGEAQREYVRLLWQRMDPDRRELEFLSGLLRGLKPGR